MLAVLLLSVDSLVAGAVLAPLLTRRDRLRLVAFLAAGDLAATLLGGSLGWGAAATPLPPLTPLALLAAAAYAPFATRVAFRRLGPRLLYVLPVLLSLDNLALREPAAGAAQLVAGALMAAAASAALGLAGICLGALVVRAAARLAAPLPAHLPGNAAPRLAIAGLLIAAAAALAA